MSRIDSTEEKTGPFGGNAVGIGFLVIAFVVSLVISVRNTWNVERPTKPVLRIAHWQLESGYRDALQAVIDDYKKLHPEIDVVQMPVTEQIYKQWINTQLISGTAPDMCELGQSDLLSKDEGTVRYFLPLSGEITKPNPYNKGTDLEQTPWKETLLDGMRGGFREGLQNYYGVPTTLTSMRLFYNKELLKSAADYYNSAQSKEVVRSDAPATFGQWMVQCKAIRAYATHTHQAILPITSCYGLTGVQEKLEPPFTADMAAKFDLDLDGTTSEMETYIAYLQGKFDLDTPALRAVYTTSRLAGDQMQQGFSGIDRQTAQFRFVNGQAGFLWTGSWDASGTVSQAQQKGFEVGIFKVPSPGPNDPNGDLVVGQAGETIGGAGVFGISKSSPNIPAAIDFLRYLSSRGVNEKFNRLAQWPPMTIGAEPSELMKPFTTDLRGLGSHLQLLFGTRVSQDVNTQLTNYYQGDDTYESFKKSYQTDIADPQRGGDWAWWFLYDTRATDARNSERLLAQTQTLDLIDPASADPARYRRALLQEVSKNNGQDYLYLFKKYRGFDMPMH